MSAPIAEAGLIVDIAGAWALAFGLMVKRPKAMVDETTTYPGHNSKLLRSMAEQKADAQVGAVLLTVGFLGRARRASGGSRLGLTHG